MNNDIGSKNGEELIRHAFFKRRNKRILVYAIKDVGKDSTSIIVETTRLVGDWRERNILRSTTCYGFETFQILADTFYYLSLDPKFTKATNRELGQIQKQKMKCFSDIQRMHK